MQLLVLEVSKGRTPWADEAAALYLKRLKRFARVEERQLKPAGKGGEPGRAMLEESKRLWAGVAARDFVVVVDERGQGLDSLGYRDLLARGERGAYQRLVFMLGGAFGHHPSSRERARLVLSLAPMVLNHQVARVVLLEQLYRAYTLLRGIPYHH